MNTYLTLFLVALSSSLFLTPVVRRLAERFGWLDVPRDGRRVHARPVPRLGGVAVYLAVLLTLAALPLVDNLITQSLAAHSRELFAVLASSTIAFLFGLYDDLRGANARWKFTALSLAGVIFFCLGGRIEALSIPFYGAVAVPPALGFALTILWVVGISNAFNLIDGLDGLAGGAALFASLVILTTSLISGNVTTTVFALALCGAITGFLRYNFNPASIFLGDSGALFVGFVLATLSVVGSQKASTAVAVAIPLMAFALPIVDTVFAIVRRFISGQPIFQGDREHIHHKLLERGWSQRRVAFVLYGVCALFGVAALFSVSDGGGGRVTGLLLLVTGAAVVLVAGRLRYHEVDEVRAGLRRNLVERRARAANNIRVRRACRALSRANTLADFFAAVRDLLELGEFAYATLQMGRWGDYEVTQRAFEREKGERDLRGAEVRGGLIHWEWGRGDFERPEIINSHLFWTLRLPLSTEEGAWGYINFYREFGGDELLLDVNYLSNLFRREMALAAKRILDGERRGSSLDRLVAARAAGQS